MTQLIHARLPAYLGLSVTLRLSVCLSVCLWHRQTDRWSDSVVMSSLFFVFAAFIARKMSTNKKPRKKPATTATRAAGIARRRHGHPRRLPREDRREDVGVSGDFPVQLASFVLH